MVWENCNIEIFRYVLVIDIQTGIVAMQRHTNWLHHFQVPDADSGSNPPNRVNKSHQGITEQHIKQVPFPMDRAYILSYPSPVNVTETFLPSPFTDVSNVFTITHIDLSCRAGCEGVTQFGSVFSLYVTDIPALSHYVELVLFCSDATIASCLTIPPLRLISNASQTGPALGWGERGPCPGR
jgi:hypothetical protein